jgi:hypothetical protein
MENVLIAHYVPGWVCKGAIEIFAIADSPTRRVEPTAGNSVGFSAMPQARWLTRVGRNRIKAQPLYLPCFS